MSAHSNTVMIPASACETHTMQVAKTSDKHREMVPREVQRMILSELVKDDDPLASAASVCRYWHCMLELNIFDRLRDTSNIPELLFEAYRDLTLVLGTWEPSQELILETKIYSADQVGSPHDWFLPRLSLAGWYRYVLPY